MIEILFGESEAASMKAAKNKFVIGKTEGPGSVWIAGRKKLSVTGWIEGLSEEVICLGFMMDIGNIREEMDSAYRKNLIYCMYAQEQWGKDEEVDAELQKMGKCYINELKRLQHYLEEGESIRIWYSDAPYSICGFYSLCGMLRNYENEMYVVKMPEYIVQENSIALYKNWGEVAAEEFAGFLQYEKKLSKEEVRMFDMMWRELQEDNSDLRAVINGKVIGVTEEFYDFLLWKELTEEPVKEARLIGDILGKYQIGNGDWWYAKRIEHFIEEGMIQIAEDSENKYARLICL